MNESIAYNVDYGPTNDAKYQLDVDTVDVSFNDLKRLALELVNTASKSRELRQAVFHFITEMLGAMRSSNDQSGIVHQMNTSLLPDVATHFGAVMSCVKDDDIIIQSPTLLARPLPACPPKGGRPTNRYKSSLEKRKNNPVKGGGQSKSCGFCKMSGHQLNKCWLLNTSEVVIWFIWDICSCFIISKYLYRRTYVYYVPFNNYFSTTWDTYVRHGIVMSDIGFLLK